MADAKYDVVLIGGGNKGLVLAMYLAKYGGMKVGIFEKNNELGGGWGSAELPLPGFLHDTYSSAHVGDYYHGPLWEDFPDWEEKGAKYVAPRVATGSIFNEDHSCLLIYNEKADPDQEQTAREIARFSERDAETWLRWWKLWKEVIEPEHMKDIWNPAPPLGTPSNMAKVLDSPKVAIDPIWKIYPGDQFFNDCFDSEELKNFCLKRMRGHSGMPPDYPTGGLVLFITTLCWTKYGFIKGGGHQLAHASIKIIAENGGEFFTRSEVDKVIIENDKAKGIRLANGIEIEAAWVLFAGMVGQSMRQPSIMLQTGMLI
jgi:phytoene dehydrogenase-like protein